VQLWKVAAAVFKSELYRLLRLNPPTDDDLAEDGDWPAGYVHIPKGTPAEWVRQLTAEHLMVTKTRQGFQKLEWQQIRERNEALDCRVYARAAAWLMGIDRWDDRRWEQLEEQLRPGKTEAAPAGVPNRPPQQQVTRRQSDWMGNGRRGKWF